MRWFGALGALVTPFFLVARPLPALEVDRPSSELTVRADSHGLFEARLVAELPTGRLRVGVLEVGAGLVPERIAPFVSTPFLLVGPLRVSGLLSEIAAPVSRSARSAAYSERTRLVIDGSFDGGSRDGVVISPLPGALDLFLVRHGVGALRVGLVARAAAPGIADGTLVLTECPRPPSSGNEGWFTDGAPGPLPDLVHCAALGRLRFGAVSVTGGGALSLTQVERPGLYGRVTVEARAGPLNGTVTAAALTPSYLLPDGSRPDECASLGADLALRLPLIELGGAYQCCLGRLSALPSRARPSEHFGEARVRIGTGNAQVAAGAKSALSFTDSGAPSLDRSADLSAALRLGPLRAELYSALAASNHDATKHAVGAALVVAAPVSRRAAAPAAAGIDVSWKSARPAERELSAAFDLGAPVEAGVVAVEARLVAPAAGGAAPAAVGVPQLTIAVGWSVRQSPR